MQDCLFCKIIAKEIPAATVYEDDCAVAVLDVSPRAPGHTLVMPRVHASSIKDISEDEIGPLFISVKKVSSLIVEALGADGVTIGINQGSASGQVIDHLHVHIMPRFYNDGGGSMQSVVNNKPQDLIEEIRDKIFKFRTPNPE